MQTQDRLPNGQFAPVKKQILPVPSPTQLSQQQKNLRQDRLPNGQFAPITKGSETFQLPDQQASQYGFYQNFMSPAQPYVDFQYNKPSHEEAHNNITPLKQSYTNQTQPKIDQIKTQTELNKTQIAQIQKQTSDLATNMQPQQQPSDKFVFGQANSEKQNEEPQQKRKLTIKTSDSKNMDRPSLNAQSTQDGTEDMDIDADLQVPQGLEPIELSQSLKAVVNNMRNLVGTQKLVPVNFGGNRQDTYDTIKQALTQHSNILIEEIGANDVIKNQFVKELDEILNPFVSYTTLRRYLRLILQQSSEPKRQRYVEEEPVLFEKGAKRQKAMPQKYANEDTVLDFTINGRTNPPTYIPKPQLKGVGATPPPYHPPQHQSSSQQIYNQRSAVQEFLQGKPFEQQQQKQSQQQQQSQSNGPGQTSVQITPKIIESKSPQLTPFKQARQLTTDFQKEATPKVGGSQTTESRPPEKLKLPDIQLQNGNSNKQKQNDIEQNEQKRDIPEIVFGPQDHPLLNDMVVSSMLLQHQIDINRENIELGKKLLVQKEYHGKSIKHELRKLSHKKEMPKPYIPPWLPSDQKSEIPQIISVSQNDVKGVKKEFTNNTGFQLEKEVGAQQQDVKPNDSQNQEHKLYDLLSSVYTEGINKLENKQIESKNGQLAATEKPPTDSNIQGTSNDALQKEVVQQQEQIQQQQQLQQQQQQQLQRWEIKYQQQHQQQQKNIAIPSVEEVTVGCEMSHTLLKALYDIRNLILEYGLYTQRKLPYLYVQYHAFQVTSNITNDF